MSALRSYAVPECHCRRLPHEPTCPLAPFFADGERLDLDWEADAAEPTAPFILTCPHCHEPFLQTEHALQYDYTPVEGHTDEGDIPLVCPHCGWSDKQTLPAIVGYDPTAEDDDEPFLFRCPSTSCGHTFDRTDGTVSVWVQHLVVQGVDELKVHGVHYKRGQIYADYTELSVYCPLCNHECGETED